MTKEKNEMPKAAGMPSMEPAAILNAPSHEEEYKVVLPEFDTPETISQTEVNIPKSPRGGIEVVATRKGFFGQQRLKEGDKFKIKDFSQIGEWMKCLDPTLENERLKLLKDKKAKR